jgi:hypothetical protein
LKIWNWKSAVMSAAYRAPIFFFTSLKSGWRLAVGALVAETAFRAFTSGFWGAFTQAVRLMEPAWLGVVLVVFVAPVVVQTLNLLFHMANGTPNLKHGFLVSCAVTALASLFNWYAMRQGTFVTGREGGSLWQDVKRLPVVIFGFVAAGPVALWRWRIGRRSAQKEAAHDFPNQANHDEGNDQGPAHADQNGDRVTDHQRGAAQGDGVAG